MVQTAFTSVKFDLRAAQIAPEFSSKLVLSKLLTWKRTKNSVVGALGGGEGGGGGGAGGGGGGRQRWRRTGVAADDHLRHRDGLVRDVHHGLEILQESEVVAHLSKRKAIGFGIEIGSEAKHTESVNSFAIHKYYSVRSNMHLPKKNNRIDEYPKVPQILRIAIDVPYMEFKNVLS